MNGATIILIILGVLLVVCFFTDVLLSCGISAVGTTTTNINDDIAAANAATATLQTDVNSLNAKTINMSASGTTTTFSGDVSIPENYLYVQGINILNELTAIENEITDSIELTGLNLNHLTVTGMSTLNGIANNGSFTNTGDVTIIGSAAAGYTVLGNFLSSSQGMRFIGSPTGYIYYTEGTSGGGAYPINIFAVNGTMRKMFPYKVDNYYLINPGFRYEVYLEDDYKGTKTDYDNTNGTLPRSFKSLYPRKCHSIKVYYIGYIYLPVGDFT